MAKTFDNISEASATNYLFLFAQRTLALQNDPPTPPPLNALGLPCEAVRAMLQLWGWLQEKREKPRSEEIHGEDLPAIDKTVGGEESAVEKEAARKAVLAKESVVLDETSIGGTGREEAALEELAGTAAAETTAAAKKQASSHVSEVAGAAAETLMVGNADETAEAAEVVTVADQASASGEETFAEKIAPLAEKITEYILDHQDDSAQEERWRTTMKRDTAKAFRKVETRLNDMDLKLDETIQLIKKLVGQGVAQSSGAVGSSGPDAAPALQLSDD